jgi:murein DD-endopeptidase MepM/ murein hydrolase activator NlpD
MSLLNSVLFAAAAIASPGLPAGAGLAGKQLATELPSGGSGEFRREMLDWNRDGNPAAARKEDHSGDSAVPVRLTRLSVSSPFGWRTDPITGSGRRHAGIDLPGRSGSRVMATAAGVVRIAGWVRGYGNLVEIEHAGGVETRYGHLERVRVAPGEAVARGEVIGDLGSTGRSTGPHVHYEVRVHGVPVDPAQFIGRAIATYEPVYSTAWAPDVQVAPKWIGWSKDDAQTAALPESRIR